MIRSDTPDIVTVVACPPDNARLASPNNSFIDETLQTLVARKAAGTRVLRAASVRDLDIRLGEILTPQFRGRIKLQIVGHSFSGALLLGAAWLTTADLFTATFNPPFFALTPDPRALGSLINYIGKISQVMLVGCNVGSDSSYGYPLNGRTLTYALAELLQCSVRGADDMVAPDEFDAYGWYAPGPGKRRPQGWQWVESSHPVWIDGGPETSPRIRAETVVSFEVRGITSTLLPIPGALLPIPGADGPIAIDPPIPISCRQLDRKRVPSAVPEISLDTDQGPAHLLCSGRYLCIGETFYAIERHPKLLETLAQNLWRHPRTTGAAAGAVTGVVNAVVTETSGPTARAPGR